MLAAAESCIKQALLSIENTNNELELEVIRVSFLGKKGKITSLLKQLSSLPNEERLSLGKILNNAKEEIYQKILLRKQTLIEKALTDKLAKEYIDINLTSVGLELGNFHPITSTLQASYKIFEKLGFELIEGPEIEDEYHNFEALNIPEHHPARAMHDTFYFFDGKLLRTHTSNIQIRIMQKKSPPFRLISAGKVYRCDSDLTHTPMFHQMEGLLINQDVNFGHLIDLLTKFLRCFFAKPDLQVRFRPSYFPFTEPSAEVDIKCVNCNANGCKVCKNTGWLEILGCGMVHPEVLKNCNIDNQKYTGWAFGIGIDRLTMLRYGINDLRLLFENDVRFLEQF